jgi:hypothetical protein
MTTASGCSTSLPGAGDRPAATSAPACTAESCAAKAAACG